MMRKKGATLLSITPQVASRIEANLKRYNLTFEILHDSGNRIARDFGVAFEMPEYLRVFYRDKGIDLVSWNGDDSWTLPIPANFIIDSNQKIVYASGDPDYTTRPEPQDLLEVLTSLNHV